MILHTGVQPHRPTRHLPPARTPFNPPSFGALRPPAVTRNRHRHPVRTATDPLCKLSLLVTPEKRKGVARR